MNGYVAIRVDVETAAGCALGLPPLLRMLEARELRATVMVPSGPDRSGLALARLLGTRRVAAMLRLRPAGSHLAGAFLAGVASPVRSMTPLLRRLRATIGSHELALHGHDHWGWIHAARWWPTSRALLELRRGIATFTHALGTRPAGFGAPGWVATPNTLKAVDEAGLAWASDCRGSFPFVPEGRRTPQVPTTLPSAEEFARLGMPLDRLLEDLRVVRERPFSCYCAHAEVEGLRFPSFFMRLLDRLQGHVTMGPLSEALTRCGPLPTCAVSLGMLPGRFAPVAVQGPP